LIHQIISVVGPLAAINKYVHNFSFLLKRLSVFSHIAYAEFLYDITSEMSDSIVAINQLQTLLSSLHHSLRAFFSSSISSPSFLGTETGFSPLTYSSLSGPIRSKVTCLAYMWYLAS
jgi:hypothetical protein